MALELNSALASAEQGSWGPAGDKVVFRQLQPQPGFSGTVHSLPSETWAEHGAGWEKEKVAPGN